MIKKAKATIEQKKWLHAYNDESNRIYVERNKKQKKLDKKIEQCTEAILGYGKALDIMTDVLKKAEQELEDSNTRAQYRDSNQQFGKKFGKDHYNLDFS